MNMLFVIDIGNTNITIGLYEGDRLKHTYRLTTKMKRTSDEYGFMLTNFMNDAGVVSSDVEDVIIASVVPKVMHSFRNCIRKYLHKEPIIIGPGVRTGISVQMENPKAVGADRILFGTDSGCYFSPAQRARIDCALLHAEEKKKILFENALQLFPQLQPDYASGCTALLQF